MKQRSVTLSSLASRSALPGLAVLAVPALLAADAATTNPVAESLRFAAEAGTTLSKTYTVTTELALDSMEVLRNGEPFPMGMDMEMDLTVEQGIEVVDRYVAVADGRPTELLREFVALANTNSMAMSNPMTGDMDMEIGSSSDLEDLQVRFTWNPESGDYDASFPEGVEGDSDLLRELDADMDLRSLLPVGDVEPGAVWEVDPQGVVSVIVPGGNLKLVPDEDADTPMGGMPGQEMSLADMLGEVDGDVTCTFTGVRDADGARIAVIQVAIDVYSTNDMTELAAEQMDNLPDQGAEIDVQSMDVEWTFEGEGELLWNLSAGHVHAFELTGDTVNVMDMAMTMSMQGSEMNLEQSLELSGTLALTLNTERL